MSQPHSIHWRTLMRTMVLVTTWVFCFSIIVGSPIILALMSQYVTSKIKAGTATSAWAHNTAHEKAATLSSVNRDKPFGPTPWGDLPKGPNQSQSEEVGEVVPKGEIYLIMDLSVNRLFVKRGGQTLYTAVASAGSGKVLKDPRNPSHHWTFETPKGTFGIESKLIDPVWIQPDWAFIERGQPVPHDQTDRLRPGVLGKYALGFGNGYFIHGALYTNLLGTNHTHGCIQLGDEDLALIFEKIPLGAKLIITA